MTKLCPKCGAEIIIPGTKPKPEPITREWLIKVDDYDCNYTLMVDSINAHFFNKKGVKHADMEVSC